jgi:hypothetical protein
LSWARDPADGPVDPIDPRSAPAWPERDLWAPRAPDSADDWDISDDPTGTFPVPDAAPLERWDEAATAEDPAAADLEAASATVSDAAADLEGEVPGTAATDVPGDAASGSARWDPRRNGERRRATTAEEAVPWLIGIILALSGMIIVLLALIFTSENGALAGSRESQLPGVVLGSGQPSASLGQVAGPGATASSTASASPSPSLSPSAEPTPAFGAIEMIYLGKKTASSPVYLWRRDFSKQEDPKEQATAQQGIAGVAWSPDGTVGAVVVDGHVVAIDADGKKRPLFDGADAITFGADGSTLYAVQIGRLSGKDRAQVFAIDFTSGTSKRLTDFTYAHPQIVKDAPLVEAAFTDEGGTVRLWPTADGNLVLWILGAPGTYRVDPVTGAREDVTRTPTLVSPDGARRVETKLARSTTTLTLYDRDEAKASVKVTGLVSHLRWAPNGSEVSFTLGVLGRNGGVVQNLYLWDLVDGKAPMALTSDGTSFGAEWLGAAQSWQP